MRTIVYLMVIVVCSCMTAITGRLQSRFIFNNYCENDFDCFANDYCYIDDPTTLGTCISRQTEGESCSFDNQCLSDSCIDSKCVGKDLRKRNEYKFKARCNHHSDCKYKHGLGYFYCNKKYCVPKSESGERCFKNFECSSGLCSGTSCA